MQKKVAVRSKPKQSGWYRFWAEGALGHNPSILHVRIERDEDRVVDIGWGLSWEGDEPPHKTSERKGWFEGPYTHKDLALVKTV